MVKKKNYLKLLLMKKNFSFLVVVIKYLNILNSKHTVLRWVFLRNMEFVDVLK